MLWLSGVASAVLAEEPTAFLDGSRLITNPVYVQDLAFWLPVMGWLAHSVSTAPRDRLVLVAGGLDFWVIEGFGVAVDQWMGYRADPTTVWATAGTVWLLPQRPSSGSSPPGPSFESSPARPAREPP
jgi:hypothetical protein